MSSCKRFQVVGWKLAEQDGKTLLRGEWKVKNFSSGLELFQRLAKVCEEENHHPDFHLENYNLVTVDLWTHTAGKVI